MHDIKMVRQTLSVAVILEQEGDSTEHVHVIPQHQLLPVPVHTSAALTLI